ncbi:N-acetylgalactosamine 6-sulfatase (GALNS) [Lentisphaera araneosa HTCC2155]|uniref:N-acetylgalactosamine 6-sulfatase (GALNS) n=1 Tax=Lentisphaera araneosa HTCC2155 TaxID=313628 RepID=A6DKM2_9BACT|nr:sulfatase [Lentisphaera araneosa]EDM27920.1 N-acetylgalactosamine 6-sulfatase (GALNS) [Lentisphaera araneosa HTCC2155]
MKIYFILSCLCFTLFGAQKPNIILILADDLGGAGLGCYGNEFFGTPNIDALAAKSMRFDNAYSGSTVCAPSRACLMSGQYVGRHKITWVSQFQRDYIKKKRGPNLNGFRLLQPVHPYHMPEGTITLGQAFKDAGYATAMFGKWHLGHRPQDQPDKMGFDEYLTFQGMKHFAPYTLPNKVQHGEKVYLTDLTCDKAIDFMERKVAAEKPFFLYYPDFLVHAPMEAKQAMIQYFEKKTIGQHHKSVIGAAMTKHLDDTVGRLVKKVDELGIAENTIIIFTSDNGGLGYKSDGGYGDKGTSNYPYRSAKSSHYEGGSRVPLIFHWPGVTEANSLSHEVVSGIDIYPTLLKIAQVAKPQEQILDGIDFSSILKNPKQKLPARDLFHYQPIYNHKVFGDASVSLRRGDMKYIYYFVEENFELFNLKDDVSQKKDLSADYPELCEELKKACFKHLDETDALRMTLNPDYDPKLKVQFK